MDARRRTLTCHVRSYAQPRGGDMMYVHGNVSALDPYQAISSTIIIVMHALGGTYRVDHLERLHERPL